MTEIPLAGAMGNAGRVFRVGETVRKPWRESAGTVHTVLNRLAEVAPGVAPVPLERDEQGREVVSWLPGEVALPPFPAWSREDRYLASVGRLLRRLHDALLNWEPPPGSCWNQELADPEGGPVIAHSDVCPENVVARDGVAVAVLDWEFAAPGRAVWDVVSTARLCIPFTHPSRRDPSVSGLSETEIRRRLLVLLDGYDLSDEQRTLFPAVLDQRRQVGDRFVLSRAAAGEQAFSRWATPEGRHRLEVEKEWIAALPADVAQRIQAR